MLKQRIITALLLLPLVVWGVLGLPTGYFALALASVFLLCAWEWCRLSGFGGTGIRVGYLTLQFVIMWLI